MVHGILYHGYLKCHKWAIVDTPESLYLCRCNRVLIRISTPYNYKLRIMNPELKKKLSIIAFSGDFDKLTAVFTLATGAAAVGYEVNIFFTFWGLDAIKKKQGRSFVGGNGLTKLFGFMMGGLKVTPTSRFNFGGIGPRIFRYLMRKNNVATLEELVEAAKALGINLYACEMAMHVLGLKKEDFISEVKDVLGVATFLKLSEGGRTLFI
ncbi:MULTISPECIES: DsrE/DsrF/DrsH-like family protein [Segatella]|nr:MULTISPECIES: DsrE/DsrF/DrsH-like family protein [Segatella]